MSFKPINVGLSPNTERDDVTLAARLLFSPGKWVKGNAVSKLEEKFKEFLGTKHTFAFRSGRSALEQIINSLGLKKGDEVLLQSFTCVVVPNAVIWAGGTPTYVDVNNDFNMSAEDLEKKISPRSKALIIQHTFGLPADMDKLMAIAKKHKLIVIEDCAHSLGAEYKIQNQIGNIAQKTGTFGDFAIFSFGRDKIISSVFGGMAVVKSDANAEKLRKIRNRLKLPSMLWVKRQLLHPVIMNSAVLPFYSFLKAGKAVLELTKRLKLISKAVNASEKIGTKAESVLGKMPNALALLAIHQLEKINRLNRHREKLAMMYEGGLMGIAGIELPKNVPDKESVYLRYTIKTPHAEKIIKLAREENILLDDWYRPAIAPAGTDNSKIGYNPDSCPNAERISKLALNLPTSINTSEQDASEIIEFIRKNH